MSDRPVTSGSGESPRTREGIERSVAAWTRNGMSEADARRKARQCAIRHDRRQSGDDR